MLSPFALVAVGRLPVFFGRRVPLLSLRCGHLAPRQRSRKIEQPGAQVRTKLEQVCRSTLSSEEKRERREVALRGVTVVAGEHQGVGAVGRGLASPRRDVVQRYDAGG